MVISASGSGILSPKAENWRGSNCSGADAQPGRVLTLGNTSLTSSDCDMVFVDGVALHQPDYVFTHNASASTVLFNKRVFNDSYIKVVYFV